MNEVKGMEDISGVFVPKTWLDEAIARANEYLNLYQTMHDEAQGYQNLYQTMHDEAQEYQSERDDALARAEAAERRAAELETQLAALRAAGEQEKKYELGRLALLAGVVANDEVSAHEMSEQIAQAIITLRAQLAAGEWRPVSEPPDDIDADYLVWQKGTVDVMMWTGNGWLTNLAYWSPSHWKPLPAPPQE